MLPNGGLWGEAKMECLRSFSLQQAKRKGQANMEVEVPHLQLT